MTITTDYRVHELAEVMKVTPQTVRNWIKSGRLPGAYKVPDDEQRSEWRIPAEAVEGIRQRKATARPIPDDLDALMDMALGR